VCSNDGSKFGSVHTDRKLTTDGRLQLSVN